MKKNIEEYFLLYLLNFKFGHKIPYDLNENTGYSSYFWYLLSSLLTSFVSLEYVYDRPDIDGWRL